MVVVVLRQENNLRIHINRLLLFTIPSLLRISLGFLRAADTLFLDEKPLQIKQLPHFNSLASIQA